MATLDVGPTHRIQLLGLGGFDVPDTLERGAQGVPAFFETTLTAIDGAWEVET